ncbi:MAG: TSUP family transporter, partial [Selenomonadaceae bacterium]|nr:TSUP family transporter [Selenomonadaceae bacterium]
MIFLSMVLLGAVIGFVGAGGAGVTIALLTVGFDVPIHTALAVALAAMVFTMISGTYSHFREHEVE